MEINQRKLFEHFLATGQPDKAEEILRVYPNFKEKEKIPEPTKPKEAK